MAVKLERHGLKWYFNDQAPRCLECRSTEVIDGWPVPAVDQSQSLRVKCHKCGCAWIQTRDGEGEQDASTDLR